jgi:hypothetical protein
MRRAKSASDRRIDDAIAVTVVVVVVIVIVVVVVVVVHSSGRTELLSRSSREVAASTAASSASSTASAWMPTHAREQVRGSHAEGLFRVEERERCRDRADVFSHRARARLAALSSGARGVIFLPVGIAQAAREGAHQGLLFERPPLARSTLRQRQRAGGSRAFDFASAGGQKRFGRADGALMQMVWNSSYGSSVPRGTVPSNSECRLPTVRVLDRAQSIAEMSSKLPMRIPSFAAHRRCRGRGSIARSIR